MGMRPLRAAHLFSRRLGQDTGNRLEALPIASIQNRILVAPPVMRYFQAQAAPAPSIVSQLQSNPSMQGRLGQGVVPSQYASGPNSPGLASPPAPTFPSLSTSDAAALSAIAASPTQDEINDLSLIDAFFSQPVGSAWNDFTLCLTPALCARLSNPEGNTGGIGDNPAADALSVWLTQVQPGQYFGSASTTPNASPAELAAITGSAFFCPPAESLPMITAWGGMAVAGPPGTEGGPYFPAFFQIDGRKTWGEIKLSVQNAVIIMQDVAQYPFPPPIDVYPGEWWKVNRPDMVQMVQVQSLLDPGTVDYWVTLSVINTYYQMVTEIQAALKAEQKRDKRNLLMHSIGLAIAAIVVAILAPEAIGVVVSAVKTGISTYTTIEQQRQAAQQTEDVSKLFASDSPAFSAKADALSQMLDQQASDAEKAAPLTAAMQAAIDEVGSQISPVVYIGGGVAILGVAAYFVFFR